MNNTYQSIGLFIDGGYYAKVNEALSDHFDLNINLRALMTLIREQIARMSGVAPASCHITESHYFLSGEQRPRQTAAVQRAQV